MSLLLGSGSPLLTVFLLQATCRVNTVCKIDLLYLVWAETCLDIEKCAACLSDELFGTKDLFNCQSVYSCILEERVEIGVTDSTTRDLGL
jgi:hypothetical protein